MPDIQNIISDLKKKYEQSYGFAVLDLDLKEDADAVIITGEVLTARQREEVVSSVTKASGKRIEDRIRVLGDPESTGTGWAVVRSEVADLRSRFVPNAVMNEKILKRVRASQAKDGEVLRVLLQKEDQLLVQAGDLAMGWIDSADVSLEKGSLREKWCVGIIAKPDELIPVPFSKADFIKEAEKFLGVKYVLGAKSEEAIDCSGLTQSVYGEACGIILPKYSWDQKRMGIAVPLSEAETGDLVFMLNKRKGTKHVGIWEEATGGGNIIHASLSQGKVVRQKADEVFERYEPVEVRRIISRRAGKWKSAAV